MPCVGAGSGSSDFFRTLELTGLDPKDAAGNPVPNAVFSSASGTRYFVNGVVPEPGSLLLLGTGLALWVRRVAAPDTNRSIIVAPGLELKVAGGLNFPTSARVGLTDLFGAQ